MTEQDIPYADAHTHLQVPADGVVSILNLPDAFQAMPEQGWVSAGIHPWHVKDHSPDDTILQHLHALASLPRVLAIGECGLDRLAEASLAMQEMVFKVQVDLAADVRKPLIIHCVKAFDDLIRLKKSWKIGVPMVVHGFNNNAQIAAQLQQHGFYLSFGKALLQESSNASTVIRDWPAERLFLETDDAGVTISAIFEAAALRRKTNVDGLKRQVFQNFKSVFFHE